MSNNFGIPEAEERVIRERDKNCVYCGKAMIPFDSSRYLDSATIERYWALAHDAKGSSPYSIPALQSDSPVPVYLLVCGRDPLRDDSLAMARALRANGRDVAVDMVESATHGFLHDGLGSSLASDTLKRLGRWIEDKRNWNSNRQR